MLSGVDGGGVGRLLRGTWLGEPPAVDIFRIVPELDVRERRTDALTCTSAVVFDLCIDFLTVEPEGGFSLDKFREKDLRCNELFPWLLERRLSALKVVVSAEVVWLLLKPLVDFLMEEARSDRGSPVGGFPSTRFRMGEFGALSELSLSSEDPPTTPHLFLKTSDGPEGGRLSDDFLAWDFLPEARTMDDGLGFPTRALLDAFLIPVEPTETTEADLGRRRLPVWCPPFLGVLFSILHLCTAEPGLTFMEDFVSNPVDGVLLDVFRVRGRVDIDSFLLELVRLSVFLPSPRKPATVFPPTALLSEAVCSWTPLWADLRSKVLR